MTRHITITARRRMNMQCVTCFDPEAIAVYFGLSLCDWCFDIAIARPVTNDIARLYGEIYELAQIAEIADANGLDGRVLLTEALTRFDAGEPADAVGAAIQDRLAQMAPVSSP